MKKEENDQMKKAKESKNISNKKNTKDKEKQKEMVSKESKYKNNINATINKNDIRKNSNRNTNNDENNKQDNLKNEKVKSKNTFHNYLWYLIIFSILGLILETIFCFITTGNIESRKGLILGPLCPIYGCGAVILIFFLNKYKGHKLKLLVYGTILGAIIEYLISFLLEGIYGARFWDYSWTKLNLNGRICLKYSIYWGILTILLINIIKEWIDKLINKIQGRVRKIIDVILAVLLVIDVALTVWSVATYETRARESLNGKNYISNNTIIEKFQNTVFSNENMKKIFPNLRIVDDEGNTMFIKDILK